MRKPRRSTRALGVAVVLLASALTGCHFDFFPSCTPDTCPEAPVYTNWALTPRGSSAGPWLGEPIAAWAVESGGGISGDRVAALQPGAALVLSDDQGAPVAGTSLLPAPGRVEFRPLAPLRPGATYSVALTGAVTGRGERGDRTWSFTAWQPQGLDPAFGDAGAARLRAVRDVVPGPGSGLTVTGVLAGAAVSRLDGAGLLDPSFGVGGEVVLDGPALGTRFNPFPEPRAVALDGDGRTLMGGQWLAALWEVVRLDQAGNLDPAFGSAGQLMGEENTRWEHVAALRILPGGGLLLGVTSPSAYAWGRLLRRSQGGAVDPSFGTGGAVLLAGELLDLALLPDGGSLVSTTSSECQARLERRDPAGALVATFGNGGALCLDDRLWLAGLAVDAAGRILLAGATPQGTAVVLRLGPDGQPDESFGLLGRAASPVRPHRRGLALAADGRVAVAGSLGQGPGEASAVAWLDADGAVLRQAPLADSLSLGAPAFDGAGRLLVPASHFDGGAWAHLVLRFEAGAGP